MTNNCESLLLNFNQSFYKESPSIITLINVLINEVQTKVNIKLRNTHLPNLTEDRRAHDRQARKEKLIMDYKNGKIDRYHI